MPLGSNTSGHLFDTTFNTNGIVYSAASGVLTSTASANSGVLVTSSAGVPSVDTTDFAVLTTGLQLKGNNANTAPPAGFIGEQIRATVAAGAPTTVNNLTETNVTQISLTAGIWDVSCCLCVSGITTGVSIEASISTTSATRGTSGDNAIQVPCASTTASTVSSIIPAYRITLSSTTTVYLVAFYSYSVGTGAGFGRISATRVG